MAIVTICRETRTHTEPGFTTRNHVQNSCTDNGACELCHYIRNDIPGEEAARSAEADSDRRIKVSSRNMSHRVGHRQHRQTKRKRNTKQSDTDSRKSRRQHSAATTSEDQ